MHFISLGFQYVITALIILSKEEKGTAIPAAELARPLNSPSSYLSQRLAKLIPLGILGSKRGLNGGVYLAKEPDEISLYSIIVAIEGDDFFTNCFLGYKNCGSIEACPFHEEWSERRNSIRDWLMSTTLADVKIEASDDWMRDRLTFDPKS